MFQSQSQSQWCKIQCKSRKQVGNTYPYCLNNMWELIQHRLTENIVSICKHKNLSTKYLSVLQVNYQPLQEANTL